MGIPESTSSFSFSVGSFGGGCGGWASSMGTNSAREAAHPVSTLMVKTIIVQKAASNPGALVAPAVLPPVTDPGSGCTSPPGSRCDRLELGRPRACPTAAIASSLPSCPLSSPASFFRPWAPGLPRGELPGPDEPSRAAPWAAVSPRGELPGPDELRSQAAPWAALSPRAAEVDQAGHCAGYPAQPVAP